MVSYRDEVPLSAAQRAVLFDSAPRGLVAAGAGSGKTRLLVAYFVHALLDLGIPLESLAAVTFTRKAGSELAERIREELARCGRPDLARSIDTAAIGTIHSLCRRLLAAQAIHAGVDPSFGILEADAESLIKEEVSKAAWSSVVEQATEEELSVLATRGDGLRTLVLSTYAALRGSGQIAPRICITGEPPHVRAREALVSACRAGLAEGAKVSSAAPTLQQNLARMAACLRWAEGSATEAEGRRRVADSSGFFPDMRTTSAKHWLEPYRESLIQYRAVVAVQELQVLVAVVNKLLERFHEEYEAYKESRGVLDFADLELRAGAMLAADSMSSSGGEPLLASHVLVDEFQDTNEVQCSIIDGLRPRRLLMVGDERQSIYGFRGADVEVFRRRQEAADVSLHRLDTNYRSRAEVLAFINHLFSQPAFFGGERFNPLSAGRAPDVVPKPDPAPGVAPAFTEIIVAERTDTDGEEEDLALQQAEAYAVAGRVTRLVREEDRRQGDIVLLLPALTHVNRYQDALLACGLDVYVVRGKGYYSQDEVADVAALLRLLLNPHDDLALLTALRSPLVAVGDDCLYLLGRARGRHDCSLWEVLRSGSDGVIETVGSDDGARLEVFRDRLEQLHARVGRPGLSRLIDDALTACNYDLCLLAAPYGKRRFANIRKLMRMAADYEALEGPDLGGFVTLIGSLGDLGDDEGNAPSLAEGEDVVRIMTVHQAKGLEFPVVLLAGLGSDPPAYKAPEIIVGSDGRMAALFKSDKKTPDQPCWGPAAQLIAEQRVRGAEEDVRLLYVAMTRARDKLILLGARKLDDKPHAKRIGRILEALGLEAPPIPGTAIPLPDVHAVAMGVAPSTDFSATGEECPVVAGEPSAVAGEGRAVGGTAPSLDRGPAGANRVAEAPRFLDLPAPGIATRQVSFSALAAYERCPRRFYLERVLGLGLSLPPWSAAASPDGDGPVSEPRAAAEDMLDGPELHGGIDVGLIVHALLEQLDLAADRPSANDLRRRAEAIAAERGLEVRAGAVERAASLAAAFWDSPLAGLPGLAGALREAPFFFVQSGVAVNGVMDLLIQDEGRWLVADYKSNTLGSRSPGDIAEGYALQAAMYCLAALKAGAPAVRMEFLFLERPSDPAVFVYSREQRAELEHIVERALAGVKAGDFCARTGPACGDCGTKYLCDAMNRRRLVVE